MACGLGVLALLLPPQTRTPTPDVAPIELPTIASDYTSFFAGTNLEWSGWSVCPAPIRWTIDVSALSTTLARREVRRMRVAMWLWAAPVGATTLFMGRQEMRYDVPTNQLVPQDGSPPKSRHVYIGVIKDGEAPQMTGNVIGLAMPTRVAVATRTIVTGMAVMRATYVRRESLNNPDLVMGLYLHELGHVFGLGHAQRAVNVMEPTVRAHRVLGPGDIRGVQRTSRPCGNATTPEAQATITNLVDVIDPHLLPFLDTIPAMP